MGRDVRGPAAESKDGWGFYRSFNIMVDKFLGSKWKAVPIKKELIRGVRGQASSHCKMHGNGVIREKGMCFICSRGLARLLL